MLKKLFKVLIIPLTLIGLFLYMYFSEGLDNVIDMFCSLKYIYFITALLVMFLSLVAKYASFAFMRRHYQKGVPYYLTLHTGLMADFWEYLTPTTFVASSIIHINVMNKQGLPPSKGAVVILSRQICSVVAFLLLVIVMFGVKIDYFVSNFTPLLWFFFALGLFLNLAIMASYLIVPRFDRTIIKIAFSLVNFLSKLHIVSEKRKVHLFRKTIDQVHSLKNNVEQLDYKPYEWVVCVLIILAQDVLLYSVHYFSSLALGVKLLYSPLTFIAVLSVMEMITSVLPIPGGIGINDFMFYRMVEPIVGGAYINFMLLFYRLVTYYFPILLGSFTLPFRIKHEKAQK